MKTKPTRLETRAQAWCERVKESPIGEPSTFAIEWRRSRTWGRIAVIETNDGKAAEASGCGYNKESAALAQFLQFLGTTEDERRAIARNAGAGFSSVARALTFPERGDGSTRRYELTAVHEGTNVTVYSITPYYSPLPLR